MKQLIRDIWYFPVSNFPEEERDYWEGQYDGSMGAMLMITVLFFLWRGI